MNEMNNGGNNLNNENYNSQEFNNVNNENNNYSQNYNSNMNYSNEPINNNQNEEPKNSYKILLIVFMVISLLLAGYIVYDKVLKKEDTPKQEINNQNKPSNQETNNQNEKNEVEPTKKFDEKYFEVKSISKKLNDKTYDVNFGFYVNTVKSGDEVKCDLIINDKVIESSTLITTYSYRFEDWCYNQNKETCNFKYLYGRSNMDPALKEVDDALKSMMDNIEENYNFGLLKDEANNSIYLYFVVNNRWLYILDSNMNVITKNQDRDGEDYITIEFGCNDTMYEPKNCNSKFAVNTDGSLNSIYLDENDIRFLWVEKENYDEDYNNVPVVEYKLTIKNGAIQKTKVNQCQVRIESGVC